MATSYWIKQKPETPAQQVAQFGNDRVASIVKASLIDYAATFLDAEGKNRGYVASAFPSMNIYVTDSERLELSNDDPSRRKLELAGLYERVKQQLPCILFDDDAVEYVNPGIGKFYKTNLLDRDRTQFWIKVIRDVSVKLIIGATDQTTCSQIRDAVSVMFGDLCRFTNGNILKSEGDLCSTCEVVLIPNKFQLGSVERVQPGSGDAANHFVSFAQGTLTCRFEGAFAVESNSTSHVVTGKVDGCSIEGPSEMDVGTSARVVIRNCPPIGMRVFSTDGNVVALQKEKSFNSYETFKALALRPGTAKIQLVDTRLPGKRDGIGPAGLQIVKELEIQVKR